jgi:hypothetical protein
MFVVREKRKTKKVVIARPILHQLPGGQVSWYRGEVRLTRMLSGRADVEIRK